VLSISKLGCDAETAATAAASLPPAAQALALSQLSEDMQLTVMGIISAKAASARAADSEPAGAEQWGDLARITEESKAALHPIEEITQPGTRITVTRARTVRGGARQSTGKGGKKKAQREWEGIVMPFESVR